jgi:hypothetical protein
MTIINVIVYQFPPYSVKGVVGRTKIWGNAAPVSWLDPMMAYVDMWLTRLVQEYARLDSMEMGSPPILP